ncbi:MAG: hypothetical protein U0931_07075 [Vulcanimicrobiota bacterium]
MKKSLTVVILGLLAMAGWAQPPSPAPGADGSLPGYEQPRPGWVNGQDATSNPGSNPANSPWNQGGGRHQRGWRNGQNGQNGQGGFQNGRGGGRGRRWARFDTNGDGQLDQGERAAAKAQIMKRFDSNGDGQLDDQERQAIRAMRGQHGGGGRRHRGQFNNGNSPMQNSAPPNSQPGNGTSNNSGPLG